LKAELFSVERDWLLGKTLKFSENEALQLRHCIPATFDCLKNIVMPA
jgi:hypothetical protein